MAENKKPFKVKIKYEDTESTKALKQTGKVVGGVFKGALKAFLTMLLIIVITGTLVVGITAIYVMQDVDMEASLDLANIDYNYTTIIYGVDDTGEPIEIQRIYANGENRVWVDLEEIPEHVQWAFICTEDQRFHSHDGVDFKRTIFSFLNMFLGLSETTQGGSTITQQLIKNVTQDKDVTIQRKVTEIFRALNLEKHYHKDDILEAYLNVIGLGNGANGVQSAANIYFNKDVSELTLAEAACLVAITNNPTVYDPFTNPEQNKKRQVDVLWNMYTQGKIDEDTYNAAIEEELVFNDEKLVETLSVWSYYVDQVVWDAIDSLVEEKGYTEETARELIYSGGYRIYTPMNVRIQEICEDFYSTVDNFPTFRKNKEGKTQQSAIIIMDMKGQVVAMVGGVGQKEGSLVLNRATMSQRQNGSTMKPLGAYGPAVEYNLIHFSSVFPDTPFIEEKDENGKVISRWPANWCRYYEKKDITVDYALQRSLNTVAVKVCDLVTPKTSYDFVTTRLGMDLVKYMKKGNQVFSDIAIAPMSIGALTTGVTLEEVCASYVPFANGGTFYEPITFTKIVDVNDEVVISNTPRGITAFSPDTATVMNRLLQNCIYGPNALATDAKIKGWEVMGKTGTTEDYSDLWFAGATPYYCGAVWIGYDIPEVQSANNYPVNVWQKIMSKVHQGMEVKNFTYDGSVIQKNYCTVTGKLASLECKSTRVGYYKSTYIPEECKECGKPKEEVSSKPAEDTSKPAGESSSKPAEGSSKPTEEDAGMPTD